MLGKKKVLIVDDSRDIVEMLKLGLEAAGYEVVIARDGEQALNSFREKRPDLVLLDMMLPKCESGVIVCQQMKKLRRETPVVLMTAVYKQRKYRMEAMTQYGADEYLMKPLSIQDLLQTIKGFLRAEEDPLKIDI
jgi:DNA-binding response OmpR family regulator